ncbi:MAG: hypothetical protein ACO3T4_00450, partial [Candidatus Nanopelagicales bacterium]
NVAIVENDTTLKVNPYTEMVRTLHAAGIKVSNRISKDPAKSAIAVGWRKLIRTSMSNWLFCTILCCPSIGAGIHF